MVDQVKCFGLTVIHHSCGAIRKIFPDLIEIGVDEIHPIRALAKGMQPAALRADFKPEDFRHWYDPTVDPISPILDTCIHSDDLTAILTTGNKSPDGKWTPALAVTEKRCGAGRYRICQVALAGCTAANPVTGLFARRLIIGSDDT